MIPRRRIRIRLFAAISIAISLFFFGTAYGDEESLPAEVPDGRRLLLAPYPFFNDTIGAGLGVAAIAEGYLQRRTLTVASALYSTENTYLLFLMMRNFQVPWVERLFLEPSTSLGEFTDIKSFTGFNPEFPNQRPGSNDSSKDNFIESDGSDFWVHFNTKYLLPIGHGREYIFPDIKLEDGIVVSGHPGGEHWNPLKSGRTFIEFEPFLRRQSLDDEEGTDQNTAGIEIALTYDNTDFLPNPSKGNYLRVFFDRDWGDFDSSAPWTVWGGEFSQYFSLGPTENARQRVIAFNFWSVDTPTWNSSHTEDGEEVFHRPPTYMGGNLGGLWRLRGYPATRFNDRAAIYYGLEYRHTLQWNPLKAITMGGKLDVDWLQLVGFGELGRVAPEWDFDDLHQDMKYSAGVGLRVMLNHVIIRVDVAKSSEEVIAQLFVGQPWPKR